MIPWSKLLGKSNSYLDDHDQIMLIGLISAALFTAICLYYVVIDSQNYALVAMATGTLVHSIMLTGTYHGHNSKQRLLFGVVVAVMSGTAFGLGSYAGNSLYITSIGLLFILFLVGMVDSRHLLLASSLLFSGISYVLGFGMSAPMTMAINYGVYFTVGALLLVVLGVMRVTLRSYLFDIHETLPFIDTRKILWINYHNFVYTFGLLSSVLLCNYFAFHFNLKHGYWLPLTAFFLMKNNHAASVNRSIHRLAGTFLGGSISLIWSICISSKLIMALAMFPLLYFTLIAVSKHYGSFVLFFTITICNLINIASDTGIKMVEERMVYTFIGVLIVILILQILRPIANLLIDER